MLIFQQASIGFSIPITDMFSGSIVWKGIVYAVLMMIAKALVGVAIYFEFLSKSLRKICSRLCRRKDPNRIQPTSDNVENEEEILTPPHMIALLVGFAMIARGEIGFLIASLSQSSGTLTLQHTGDSESSDEQVFLVIVWAVVLCTIAGPVGVGILVRRFRRNPECVQSSNWI